MFTNYIAKNTKKGEIDPRIAGFYHPQAMIVEQYRNMRTYLGFHNGRRMRSIMVTSASRGEGKSVTAANLAVTIAGEKDKKVLLINADMRSPSIEKLLCLEPAKGLNHYLRGDAQLSEIIMPTRVDSLAVLPAPAPVDNPTEILSSPKMKELIALLQDNFNCLIIDTPAIMPYADARIIGPLVDGVLLVVEARRTRREVVWRTQEQINSIKANLLGIVLTKVEYYIPEYIHRHL